MHKQTELSKQSLLDKVYFSGVTIDILDLILPKCEDLLKEAVKTTYGRIDYDDLKLSLYKGEQQLWIVGQGTNILACSVTEIVLYPKLKVCKINICTGSGHSRHQWQSYITEIENWAISQGCERIESLARKGWSRVLKDWEVSHYFIEKPLNYGKQLKTSDNNTNK